MLASVARLVARGGRQGTLLLLLAMWPLLEFLRLQAKALQRQNRPKRIILVRHGESQGNVDKSMYGRMPDSHIELTQRGFAQGRAAGEQLRSLIGNESVRFFFSPYVRTRQTLVAILQAFAHRTVQLTSEPRLREQDFGNFQDSASMEKVYAERQKFGRFYYRFPNGEAGTDVYARVCDFWSALYRFMDVSPSDERYVENFVLITHGLLMRIFCMCYFRWTVLEFEQVWNPSNCEIWVLEKTKGGRFRVAGSWQDGAFRPIKFGDDQSQDLYEHMREPLSARKMVPGSPDALADVALAHLRVPGSLDKKKPGS